ncbi:unnamed protein product [Cunninghamella blakesleeana]
MDTCLYNIYTHTHTYTYTHTHIYTHTHTHTQIYIYIYICIYIYILILFFIMYFSLPTSQEREKKLLERKNKNNKDTVPSINTTTIDSPSPSSLSPKSLYNKYKSNNISDERFVEIVENLEDHWRSPPILTPTTLALIFNNNNWIEPGSSPLSANVNMMNDNNNSNNNNNNQNSLSRKSPTTDNDIISLASLQCFLSQFQKTLSQHIPSLEKIIKEDETLCQVRNGDANIAAHNAIDHLTQLLAMYNNQQSSSSLINNND